MEGYSTIEERLASYVATLDRVSKEEIPGIFDEDHSSVYARLIMNTLTDECADSFAGIFSISHAYRSAQDASVTGTPMPYVEKVVKPLSVFKEKYTDVIPVHAWQRWFIRITCALIAKYSHYVTVMLCKEAGTSVDKREKMKQQVIIDVNAFEAQLSLLGDLPPSHFNVLNIQ